MRNSLTSGAVVEAAVTVAVAVLMTVAGFEMLKGLGDEATSAARLMSRVHAVALPQIDQTAGKAVVQSIQLPHVDSDRG